jgi:hypothetical protein
MADDAAQPDTGPAAGHTGACCAHSPGAACRTHDCCVCCACPLEAHQWRAMRRLYAGLSEEAFNAMTPAERLAAISAANVLAVVAGSAALSYSS